MGLTYAVYANELSDSLIPQWVEMMNPPGMICEIHPEFSFADHSGFLPFKLRLTQSAHKALIGIDFLTGFEFYSDPFNLDDEIEHIRPKQGLLGQLTGRSPEPTYFADAEIDARLRHYRTVATFNWGAADLFELRMATLASAALTNLLDGQRVFADNGIWYGPEFPVEEALREAERYEGGVPPREHRVHPFENWL